MEEKLYKAYMEAAETLRCYSATWLKRAVARYEATGEEPYIPVRIGQTALALWKLAKLLIDQSRKKAGRKASCIESPYSTPVFNTGQGKEERNEKSKEVSPTPPLEKKKEKKEEKQSPQRVPVCACAKGDERGEETQAAEPVVCVKLKDDGPSTSRHRMAMVHDYYNAAAGGKLVPLPPLTERLVRSMAIALRGYKDGEIRHAIDRAAASNVLSGREGRGFRADFFWVFNNRNYSRIESGFYDNKENFVPGSGTAEFVALRFREEQLGEGSKAEVERTLW